MPKRALKTHHMFLAFQTESYFRNALSFCIQNDSLGETLTLLIAEYSAGLCTSHGSTSLTDKLSSMVGR